MTDEWEARVAEAVLLVNRSNEVVAVQRARIEKLQASGAATDAAEAFLELCEASLARRQARLDELLAGAQIVAGGRVLPLAKKRSREHLSPM
jgi:intracellular sulfur oxidation DsrE/DsrF family protein